MICAEITWKSPASLWNRSEKAIWGNSDRQSSILQRWESDGWNLAFVLEPNQNRKQITGSSTRIIYWMCMYKPVFSSIHYIAILEYFKHDKINKLLCNVLSKFQKQIYYFVCIPQFIGPKIKFSKRFESKFANRTQI